MGIIKQFVAAYISMYGVVFGKLQVSAHFIAAKNLTLKKGIYT
jgi:hypothetical protein